MKVWNKKIYAFAIIFFFSHMASAAAMDDNPEHRLGIYYGKWTESRLPTFPKNLLTGNLDFKKTYITSVIYSRKISTIAPNIPWTEVRLPLNVEAEFTLSDHHGYQNHTEGTAGLMLRFLGPSLGNWGAMNLGWANGFSYASGHPKYEKGGSGIRGKDSRKFQYYMGFELGISPYAMKNMELFMRLHHRSGVYGLISPSKTGSNYLGVGIRYKF